MYLMLKLREFECISPTGTNTITVPWSHLERALLNTSQIPLFKPGNLTARAIWGLAAPLSSKEPEEIKPPLASVKQFLLKEKPRGRTTTNLNILPLSQPGLPPQPSKHPELCAIVCREIVPADESARAQLPGEEQRREQQEVADFSSNSDLALPFFTPWSKWPLSQGHHGLKTLKRRENSSLCRSSMPSEWGKHTTTWGACKLFVVLFCVFFLKKRKNSVLGGAREYKCGSH